MTQLHHVERQIQACENSLREEKDKRRKYHVSTLSSHSLSLKFNFILNPVVEDNFLSCAVPYFFSRVNPHKELVGYFQKTISELPSSSVSKSSCEPFHIEKCSAFIFSFKFNTFHMKIVARRLVLKQMYK